MDRVTLLVEGEEEKMGWGKYIEGTIRAPNEGYRAPIFVEQLGLVFFRNSGPELSRSGAECDSLFFFFE